MEIMNVFSDLYDEERIYSVLMTDEELRMYSRHTPKNLEKYRHQELTDKELKRMSDGEIDDLIDEDSERASRNSSKYVRKKLPKYMATAAGIGAGLGALAGPKGGKLASGLVGAGAGALIGLPIAAIRGTSKANEEGHDRGRIAKSAARRADKVKGGNSYDRLNRREHQKRQEQLDRERNEALWSNAYNSRYYSEDGGNSNLGTKIGGGLTAAGGGVALGGLGYTADKLVRLNKEIGGKNLNSFSGSKEFQKQVVGGKFGKKAAEHAKKALRGRDALCAGALAIPVGAAVWGASKIAAKRKNKRNEK